MFPVTLDDFTPHNSGDTIAESHINELQTAIEAIETKVGIDSSTDSSSLDYKVAQRVVGAADSVDSEIVLFSGTTGKAIKRASGSGVAKLTSGVLSTISAPTGDIVGTTDTQTLSNKTLTTPTISSFVNATHNHQDSAGGGTLSESALSLTDVTTNNVSTSKHGFVPKAPNDTSKFLRGDATWAEPTITQVFSSGTTTKNVADADTTQTIAHGLGKTPKYVRIMAMIKDSHESGFGQRWYMVTYNGTTQSAIGMQKSSGPTWSVTTNFQLNDANANAYNTGTITFDATNIYINWVKTNSPTGTFTLFWEAQA